jgi:hypothetical protein
VSELRHPADADPVRSTKATAVLVLGVASVLTGFLLGGLIPATIALLLAREARADIRAGSGFLVGTRRLRLGVRLAWGGVGLAAAMVVFVCVVTLLRAAGPGGTDFAPGVN